MHKVQFQNVGVQVSTENELLMNSSKSLSDNLVKTDYSFGENKHIPFDLPHDGNYQFSAAAHQLNLKEFSESDNFPIPITAMSVTSTAVNEVWSTYGTLYRPAKPRLG